MSNVLLLRSPLAELLADDCQAAARQTHPGVLLSERPFLGYLNIRTEPSVELIERIERGSGIRLPLEPNTFIETNENVALWLGPDEWLVVTPPGNQTLLEHTLCTSVHDHFLSLTDVTHGNTTIHVSGPRAIDMLSKGCSLDLSGSVSRARRCAQTLLAKTHVTIRTVDNSPAFDLIVRRSFAEYLALWLRDASLEYGLANC